MNAFFSSNLLDNFGRHLSYVIAAGRIANQLKYFHPKFLELKIVLNITNVDCERVNNGKEKFFVFTIYEQNYK